MADPFNTPFNVNNAAPDNQPTGLLGMVEQANWPINTAGFNMSIAPWSRLLEPQAAGPINTNYAWDEGGFPTPAFVAANRGMSRQDFESPLAYMSESSWQPRDTGGFFTLNDLYGVSRQQPIPPRQQGYGAGPTAATLASASTGVPPLFSRGAANVSTNNWRLLPPNLGPGWVMRNGQLIAAGPAAWQGMPIGFEGLGSETAEHGMGGRRFNAPGRGSPWGVPSILQGALYWPGGPIIGGERWPAGMG